MGSQEVKGYKKERCLKALLSVDPREDSGS